MCRNARCTRLPPRIFSVYCILFAPVGEYPAERAARSTASGDLDGKIFCFTQPSLEKAKRARLSFIVRDMRSVVIDVARARLSLGHLHSFRGMPRIPILERSLNPLGLRDSASSAASGSRKRRSRRRDASFRKIYSSCVYSEKHPECPITVPKLSRHRETYPQYVYSVVVYVCKYKVVELCVHT